MPTKTQLEDRLAEVKGRLDAVIDVLEDPDIEDAGDRVAEALVAADPETYADEDDD